jgi:hypothetical protein
MEIGSEFWLEDPWVNDDLASQIGQTGEIKWLNKFGNIVLTLSGRDAISLLLQEIKPRVKTVLLPAYICDSVIMPFIEEVIIAASMILMKSYLQFLIRLT